MKLNFWSKKNTTQNSEEQHVSKSGLSDIQKFFNRAVALQKEGKNNEAIHLFQQITPEKSLPLSQVSRMNIEYIKNPTQTTEVQ